jgi:tetratricopeptide (TPR) repeat protein
MGNYETALQHYERAIYWDDQDAYVYYSIGLCHYMLDDLARAEEAAVEAVRLEPADHDYRVFWIGVLLGLQRTGQARNEAEILFQLGFEYEGGIEALLYDLRENFYSEPEALQGS